MFKRKVLAICYNLYPDTSAQAQQISPLLQKLAEYCDVKIVSGDFGDVSFGEDKRALENVYKLKLKSSFIENRLPFLNRVLYRFLPFYHKSPDALRGSIKKVVKDIEKNILNVFYPDVIISFGHPMSDHLIGHSLSKDYEIPLITHFSDPWADNPYFKHLFPLTDRIYSVRAEKLVTSHAAAVIFTNKFGLEHFLKYREDSLKEKCFVIPHSIPALTYDIPKSMEVSGKFIIRHVGSLYGLRNPDALLASLLLLEHLYPKLINHVELEFVGYSASSVISKIKNYSGKIKVTSVGVVSPQEAADLMRESSLLVAIDADISPNIFLPSKLFDYLAHNNKVLAISPDGASSDFANAVGFSCFDPKQSRPIADAINKVIEGKCIILKNLDTYTARENAKKLNEIVEKLF